LREEDYNLAKATKNFRREIMRGINIGIFNEIIDFERGLYEKI